MKLSFKEFENYSNVIRKNAKDSLIKDINGRLDKKLILFRNHFVDEFTNRNIFLEQVKYLMKVKGFTRQVLTDEFLLNIYLDNEVRKRIINILNVINSSVDNLSAVEKLTEMGFSDADEYLREYSSLEKIRQDLFEKSGLDFEDYTKLSDDALMKQYSLDQDALLELEISFFKAGIDLSKKNYKCSDITPCEIANMSTKRLNLLASSNKIIEK